MSKSDASSVSEYLQELPAERRAVVSAVRDLVLRHLPEGYREMMGWGMITYGVPLERYPNTYNGAPLCYAALAAQKRHYALYLMGAYADPGQTAFLKDAFAKAGKKLDMGKSCVRFRKLEDLPLDALAEVIASTPPERMIEIHEASRRT